MAQGDSIVSICNRALLSIGADRINALTDNTKRAILCNEIFHSLRRDLLRQHSWNFAIKRAQLAASSSAPPFGFGAAFPLPADFLRFVDTDEDDAAVVAWTIEQNAGVTSILSDDSDNGALDIKYVYDCADPTLFDPLFVSALAGRLGMELAQPLGRSNAEKGRAAALYNDALASARTSSSQENSPREWDDDVLLRSRS